MKVAVEDINAELSFYSFVIITVYVGCRVQGFDSTQRVVLLCYFPRGMVD